MTNKRPVVGLRLPKSRASHPMDATGEDKARFINAATKDEEPQALIEEEKNSRKEEKKNSSKVTYLTPPDEGAARRKDQGCKKFGTQLTPSLAKALKRYALANDAKISDVIEGILAQQLRALGFPPEEDF